MMAHIDLRRGAGLLSRRGRCTACVGPRRAL